MNTLFAKAIKQADKVRIQLGLNMFQSINIFDACLELGLTVRFVDINMEGMYISQSNGVNPTVLLSNQRPLPRRTFTCAHELGHHVFGHGTKIDVLSNPDALNASSDLHELLVDSFAGALLMPTFGIQREFANRDLKPQHASALQFCTLSSVFGTGYQTLIQHCKANNLINDSKSKILLKETPGKILKNLLGSDSNNSHFKIIDSQAEISLIDLEVSNYLILPEGVHVDGDHLKKYSNTTSGWSYVAEKPGIVRAATSDNSLSYFIRIQNKNYIGLAENRHLENIEE